VARFCATVTKQDLFVEHVAKTFLTCELTSGAGRRNHL
jgi:hypothetical protein